MRCVTKSAVGDGKQEKGDGLGKLRDVKSEGGDDDGGGAAVSDNSVW